MSRTSGVIKFVNTEKGYGFIEVRGKKDQHYFRLNAIKLPENLSPETVGVDVEFTLKDDPRHEGKKLAVDIVMTGTSGKDEIRRLLLETLVKRQKELEPPAFDLTQTYMGRIRKVFPDKGFGFIKLQSGYHMFFHSSALVVSLVGGRIGTGVQVKVQPSTKKEGEFDAAEVVIIDEEGDKHLLDDIQKLVESKRQREMRGVERREEKHRERDSVRRLDGMTGKQRYNTFKDLGKALG